MPIHHGYRLVCALCMISAGSTAVLENDDDCTETSCSTHLLQSRLTAKRANDRNLILMHIPYNFGHTIEIVAALPMPIRDIVASPGGHSGETGAGALDKLPDMISKLKRPEGELWGHMNPELSVVSNITGCPIYFTPPKYWPSDLAERYFVNKQVFGLFRNPYERLVSIFRGNFEGYGGSYGRLHDTCDVNAAVKQMMRTYQSGDKFANDCTFLPQTEYTDMPHGVTVPIDLHEFPKSMNDEFSQHGFNNDMFIRTKDIQHVRSCDNVWAGDLDNDTRALVKQVYKRDFEFLCEKFGYCDQDEPMCLQGVPHMCPEKEFTWNEAQQKYQRRMA